MITVWRLDKAKRAKAQTFAGEGAALKGARWNHKGESVIYASETLSLAALEVQKYAGSEAATAKWVAYEVHIPAGIKIEELKIANLPAGWDANPHRASSKDLGSKWLKLNTSAVLKVPSSITKTDHNYLLNPGHPDFKKINIKDGVTYSFK